MKQTFYSNGKLLITAEYLVLDGAKALALPTKFGQNLIVENGNNNQIIWKSYDLDGSNWFENTILFSEIIDHSNSQPQSEKNTLIKILHEAYLKNNLFITASQGYIITTQLTFPKFWGLGTSSTLINNIAQWLQIDAFELLKNSFGGSGYDIACAQHNTPIVYYLENGNPVIEPVVFEPKCIENLFFVYLNQKQNSKSAIATYTKNTKNMKVELLKINKITNNILSNTNYNSICEQVKLHENIMSSILEIPTVKSNLFPDFNGQIKSLGAWGGDFVMVISDKNPTEYFTEKGFLTILNYKDMIIT